MRHGVSLVMGAPYSSVPSQILQVVTQEVGTLLMAVVGEERYLVSPGAALSSSELTAEV